MGLPFKNGFELANALGYGDMYQASKQQEQENNVQMESKKPIKITQEDIHRLVKESVNNILKEGLPSFENIECHRVLNDNFDGNWRSILTANLYDKNGNCVGRLNDLHFVYDVDKNEFEGVW